MVAISPAAEGIRTVDGVPLKIKLRRAERMRKIKAAALVAPLFLFVVVTFIVPIVLMLTNSVRNTEVAEVLPRTASAISDWDGEGLPDETVVRAFVADIRDARDNQIIGKAAKRLNYDIAGFRSLLIGTARDAPSPEAGNLLDALVTIDARWGERDYWGAIKKASVPYTAFYLLAAVDRTIDAQGKIEPVAEDQAIYLDAMERTFWISFVVTLLCLILGYPVAYLLGTLPTRTSNLLMILVLLPFWTSLLVRTTAWVVLLQREGVINDLGIMLGLWTEPLALVHNRLGVYFAMTHILLPFMVLPIFSVMKGISPTHMRAAASLGANPLRAFLKVYLPQTLPGIGAGVLLVFILALGYYITPAFVGGPRDQMLSYFIAFHTNTLVNWGMASALSALLLAIVVVFFLVYNRLVGIDKMKLG